MVVRSAFSPLPKIVHSFSPFKPLFQHCEIVQMAEIVDVLERYRRQCGLAKLLGHAPESWIRM
jgi:hypothetical protein